MALLPKIKEAILVELELVSIIKFVIVSPILKVQISKDLTVIYYVFILGEKIR